MPLSDQQLLSQLTAAIRQASVPPPSWTSFIPAVSAAISGVSACLSIAFFLRAQKNTRTLATETRGYRLLPLMVFYRLSERVWTLKNVAEGTAVKVIIRNYISESQVRDEVTLYPVATSEEIRLDYVKGPAVKLVAR